MQEARRVNLLLAVDIGGTFTDLVAVDENGQVTVSKALSTPSDFSAGVINAVEVVSKKLNKRPEDVLGETAIFYHAATVATNAVVNRTGARAALITTKGFEDTLLMMRAIGRVDGLSSSEILHATRTDKPEPLIPRSSTVGLTERIDSEGAVLVPAREEEATSIVERLLASGVESVGVSLLWSFKNPVHEEMLERLIASKFPGTYVTISSEIAPIVGEYERSSTVALNSYVGPVVSHYLRNLETKLLGLGLKSKLLVMQASGGTMSVQSGCKTAVRTIESGPVAGVVASKFLAELLGLNDLICTDMGGTTFKASVISNGEPQMTNETTFLQFRMAMPMIEVATIGAGGGSMVWVEEDTGVLRVGPQSAGADPGPACYGVGGTKPTVTDADVLLGYIDPGYFLGGTMALSKEAAREAFQTHAAKPTGKDVIATAEAAYSIVNSQMADLIRKVTVERGVDPRRFVLFAYGGASPIHACSYGGDLGVREIVVPHTASVHGAFGLAVSDISQEYQLSSPASVPVNVSTANSTFQKLEEKAYGAMRDDGFRRDEVVVSRSLDLRYQRQINQISTPVPQGELSSETMDKVYSTFESLYEGAYGKGSGYREAGMEVVTYRVKIVALTKKPSISGFEPGPKGTDHARKKDRDVFFGELSGFSSTRIYDFDKLKSGNTLEGPAVIETPVTTIVVNPGYSCLIDKYKNARMSRT